jgi:hypothetical protein
MGIRARDRRNFLGFGGERISDAEKQVLVQISPTLGLAA